MKGRAQALLLALLLDRALGDPPNRWHPVAWMGGAIARAQRRAPAAGRGRPFAYGFALVAGGSALAAGIGRVLGASITRMPAGPGLLAEALALKMMLSLRGLLAAGDEIEKALAVDDLPAAQKALSWHLVSRPTAGLVKSQVAAATIESLTENSSDGAIAPLFFYAMGGLPAALAYRFINTADAMLGYRDEAREWLGKAPARLDDLANFIPARLSALLLLAASPLVGLDGGRGWRVWRRDAHLTDSPNAGHPMSAAAGALGVELSKTGQYRLGAGQRDARGQDIAQAIRLVRAAVWLGASALTALLFLRGQR